MPYVSIYYVVVLLIPFLESAKFRCDYSHLPCLGWFKFHAKPTNYKTAKRICIREGAELVTPVTNVMKIDLLSLIDKSSVDEIHTDYQTVNRSIIEPEFLEQNNIPTIDNKSTVVLTKNGTLESRSLLAQIHFICHKMAARADELNECGTEDDEYKLQSETGNCYKFHPIRQTWSRAKEICISEGGNLAVINSEPEAQIIKNLFESNPTDSIPGETLRDSAFLGIKRDKISFLSRSKIREWKTVEDYSLPMSRYNKWSPGAPNNTNRDESCVTVLRNALMIDSPCNEEVPFICEKKIQDCERTYSLDMRTGSCYKFHRNRNTWTYASEICMNEGGNLAVINSETEAKVIRDIFQRNPDYTIPGQYLRDSAFVGVRRNVNPEWDWRTVDGQLLYMVGYNKWNLGEPNNLKGHEYCVTVWRNGMLADDPCNEAVPFICEKKIQECNDYKTDSRTGNCYKFHRYEDTWYHGMQTCVDEGGNLAVINSDIEAQVISDLFKLNPFDSLPGDFWRNYAFVGVKRDGLGQNWKTIDGKLLSASGYDQWTTGEPNNLRGDEYCAAVTRFDSKLRDHSCFDIMPFICEKQFEDCM